MSEGQQQTAALAGRHAHGVSPHLPPGAAMAAVQARPVGSTLLMCLRSSASCALPEHAAQQPCEAASTSALLMFAAQA